METQIWLADAVITLVGTHIGLTCEVEFEDTEGVLPPRCGLRS